MNTVQTFWDSQITGEIKRYTTDVTDMLPDGVTVASGSTSYVQTFNGSASGSAATTISSPDVTMVTPALSVTGRYEFTTKFTLSNGDIRAVVYKIAVDR